MRFTNRQILKITFPVLLSLMMEQLIGLTDTIYLGHVGEVELGASAIAGIFYLTIFMVGFGFSIGAQVLIARRNGEGNLAGIGPIFMQGMWFLLGMAVLFFGVSRALAPWLLGHLIESRAICAAAESYLGYRTFGFFFSFAAAMFRAFYVGTTNTRILTANSVVMVLTNVVLNYLLIFGHGGFPALGVAGAAIATLLARVSEFAICVVCAVRSRVIPLDLTALLHPGMDMARRFLKYASPVVLNEAAWGLGNSLLTVILGYTDNSVEMLAANAVMGNLSRLLLVVCFGLGAATAVLVGKAIGEGQSHQDVLELSQELLRFSTLIGAGIAVLSLLLIPTLFVPVLFPMFKLYGESIAIATALAVTAFAGIPLHAYAISAVTGVLRAGGDVAYATALDLLPQWVICLPITALCALVLKSGYWSIAIAIQVESIVKVPFCIRRVRGGTWIHDVTRGQRT